jgi:hypothetical protein
MRKRAAAFFSRGSSPAGVRVGYGTQREKENGTSGAAREHTGSRRRRHQLSRAGDVTSGVGGAHPRVLLQLGAVKVNISEARSAPKNHTTRRIALRGVSKFQSDGELSAFEWVISTRESEVLRVRYLFSYK